MRKSWISSKKSTRIEVGNKHFMRALADLAVLSRDPTDVDTEEIKDVEVEMTIVGGSVVYRKPS
jgi:predicted amidohydrolase YtcJ